MAIAEQNVAEVERWASALGGAALAAYGLKQVREERPVAGAMIAAAAGVLIYRGASGHCPMYAATGINTAETDTRTALSGARGVRVEDAVTINRSPEELYDCWRDFERLPTFMHHLVSVTPIDRRRSHWVAKAPAGRTVEWDAEIVNEIPERADRLAHARERRRRERRLRPVPAARQRLRHRGARATAVRPAGGKVRVRRRVAPWERAIPTDS